MDRDKLNKLPIFQKANEILMLVLGVIETIKKEEDVLDTSDILRGHAYVLSAKIAGAEGVDDYGLKVENAVLIRIAAREIQAHTALLLQENWGLEEYVRILRNEISEFRILLKEWVDSFDHSEYEEWEWSLNVKGEHI